MRLSEIHPAYYVLAIWATPVLFLLVYFASNPDVNFRSSDAKWADSEVQFKGRDLDRIAVLFELYKLGCDAPDAVLVRTTRRHWINIIAWPNYLTDEKWRVPYGEPVEAIGNYSPSVTTTHCSGSADYDTARANAYGYLESL